MRHATHTKIKLYRKFPVADPVELAGAVAKLDGSLVGLRRLRLATVELTTVANVPHVEFTFAEAA